MLITLKEILSYVEKKKCAIGAFDAPNIASIMAVIEASEEMNEPLIIMHAQLHEKFAPLDIIGPALVGAAKAAKTPICVHLDHGEDAAYIKRALAIGFTGIMYDGSNLSLEENTAITKEIVQLAHAVGASVEAEIGAMGKRETGLSNQEEANSDAAIYTNADDAAQFVEDTGIDALACSFGTVHGLYLKAPKLDYSVIDRVQSKISIPLVMHGGSGVSEEEYEILIKKGIRKVNYYTYMAKAGGEAVREALLDGYTQSPRVPVYFHDIELCAKDAIKENVIAAIKVFAQR